MALSILNNVSRALSAENQLDVTNTLIAEDAAPTVFGLEVELWRG